MNTTNLSTAAGAGGAALAAVVVLVWILSFAHITVPDQVVSALTVLLTFGAHWLAVQMKDQAVPAAPATPAGAAPAPGGS